MKELAIIIDEIVSSQASTDRMKRCPDMGNRKKAVDLKKIKIRSRVRLARSKAMSNIIGSVIKTKLESCKFDPLNRKLGVLLVKTLRATQQEYNYLFHRSKI
ncbi:hypothetical protein DICVIV_11276 [Dictyocaulus viviparus]|uniref:Uncharacterized protein n=1 Tax=Dictyocaulus viviparus TaxID=29172 RepID=A0A0D8XK95_DICVI|nr:hypothetical protein DICVIV_11276 [Dictyocaulus viviparus]